MITIDELIDQIAFYQLEPYGEEWLQTGQVTSTIVNMAGKQSKKQVSPEDFIPKFNSAKPVQSNRQVAANLELWKSMVNHRYKQ